MQEGIVQIGFYEVGAVKNAVSENHPVKMLVIEEIAVREVFTFQHHLLPNASVVSGIGEVVKPFHMGVIRLLEFRRSHAALISWVFFVLRHFVPLMLWSQ